MVENKKEKVEMRQIGKRLYNINLILQCMYDWMKDCCEMGFVLNLKNKELDE